jgi:hypothetical protein
MKEFSLVSILQCMVEECDFYTAELHSGFEGISVMYRTAAKK